MEYPFECITNFIFVDDEMPEEPCDVILVPGGSRPELMTEAVALYKSGLGRYILVSGNKNSKLPDYESEAMFLREIAIKENVPDDAIICEEEATNTYENALFSMKIMQEKGLDTSRVILVCKSFHSRRALFTYQKAFPSNTVFYVRTIIDERNITKDNWYKDQERINIVMGEVQKMGKYFTEDILEMYLKE